MANYHSLKNAGLAKPAASTDLGSSSNKYGNLFLDGNITLGTTVVNSNNVINPKIASISYSGDDTATSIAGGQTVTLNGAGFGSGATVLIGTTPATSTTVVSSTQITFIPPATAAGTYVLYVINSDGGTATFVTGISFSGTPTWTTSAGSLGNVVFNNSVNLSVAATGDAPITYAVKAGSSLPSGLSLNTSTGAITGTAPSPESSTTYNFTLTASDAQNQDTDRAFSIFVDVVTPPTIDYLIVAGGAGGGVSGGHGGGGGAGGYLTNTYTATLAVTYTITVGGGGSAGDWVGGNPGNFPGQGGNSSISGSGFTTVTSVGGGRGGGRIGSPASGGSGGGTSGDGGSPGRGIYPGSAYISAPRQGYDGHNSAPSGGGGAGQASTGGNGGNGLDWLNLGTYYAGGGASSYAYGGAIYSGGAGGGGAGSGSNGSGVAGSPNTGGGGGGSTGGNGAAGGSGVVIIRYADSFNAAASTTGSPTITTAGGYRTYKFTTSGSITF